LVMPPLKHPRPANALRRDRRPRRQSRSGIFGVRINEINMESVSDLKKPELDYRFVCGLPCRLILPIPASCRRWIDVDSINLFLSNIPTFPPKIIASCWDTGAYVWRRILGCARDAGYCTC
jgi:hypothetical protein